MSLLSCPRCGSPEAPAGRFCSRCGQPLSYAASPGNAAGAFAGIPDFVLAAPPPDRPGPSTAAIAGILTGVLILGGIAAVGVGAGVIPFLRPRPTAAAPPPASVSTFDDTSSTDPGYPGGAPAAGAQPSPGLSPSAFAPPGPGFAGPGAAVSDGANRIRFTLPAGFPPPPNTRSHPGGGTPRVSSAKYDSRRGPEVCAVSVTRLPAALTARRSAQEIFSTYRPTSLAAISAQATDVWNESFDGYEAQEVRYVVPGAPPAVGKLRMVFAPPRLVVMAFHSPAPGAVDGAEAAAYFRSLQIDLLPPAAGASAGASSPSHFGSGPAFDPTLPSAPYLVPRSPLRSPGYRYPGTLRPSPWPDPAADARQHLADVQRRIREHQAELEARMQQQRALMDERLRRFPSPGFPGAAPPGIPTPPAASDVPGGTPQ